MIRRKPMAQRSAYARRKRDTARMLWVKTQECCARLMYEHLIWNSAEWIGSLSPCRGETEADHAGRRGLGQKAGDDTCIPLCSQHHRERTDHTGMFKHATRGDMSHALDLMIARYRGLYQRHLIEGGQP